MNLDSFMAKVKLPREYLSYSAMSMWIKNKKGFEENYFKGNRKDLNTPAINFGKKIADQLEAGEDIGIPLTVYDSRDVAMFTTFGGVRFIYKCDGFDPKTKSFVEYKTGTFAWTQSMVNNAMQLKFYTACIYNEFGVLPKRVQLQWMPTEFTKGKYGRTVVKLKGHVETFEFKPDLLDTLKFSAQMVKTAKEIAQAYDRFLRAKQNPQRVESVAPIPRSTKRYFVAKKKKKDKVS